MSEPTYVYKFLVGNFEMLEQIYEHKTKERCKEEDVEEFKNAMLEVNPSMAYCTYLGEEIRNN